MFYLLGGLFISFFTGLVVTPLVSKLARRLQWLDVPDGGRKVHKNPTPRVGGLAILVAFSMGITFFFLAEPWIGQHMDVNTMLPPVPLLLGGLAIVLIGLYDDIFGMGFKRKFVFQFIVSYLMFLAGFRIEVPAFPIFPFDTYALGSMSLLLTLLWYVGVMNAVNLIDGLDGLASGISVIAFFSLTLMFGVQGDLTSLLLAIAIVGGLAAFLVYNFNPASIFLGDSGSLFLGFVLATYGLQGTDVNDPIITLIAVACAVGFPILDTSVAYIRRIVAGKSPFAADRDHMHHRLIERFKLSTKKAVSVLYVLNAMLGLIAVSLILFTSAEVRTGILLLAVVCIISVLWKMEYIHLRSSGTVPSAAKEVAENVDGAPVAAPAEAGATPYIEMGARQPTKAEILKMMSHLSEAEIVSWWKRTKGAGHPSASDYAADDVDGAIWKEEEFWQLEKV